MTPRAAPAPLPRDFTRRRTRSSHRPGSSAPTTRTPSPREPLVGPPPHSGPASLTTACAPAGGSGPASGPRSIRRPWAPVHQAVLAPCPPGGPAPAPNTLSPMTTGPGRAARDLCAAADEALIEAAFCTGEFAGAERMFAEAEAVAARDGDREGAALAAGGLGMTRHHPNTAN